MLIDELTEAFYAWNSRNRVPATVGFYRARLKKFHEAYNARDLASLTPLEIDEHLASAGTGEAGLLRWRAVLPLRALSNAAGRAL